MTIKYQGRKPPIICNICNVIFNDLKEFSYHLRKHKISSLEYTNKYFYNGKRPICAERSCIRETRYIRFTYKKYCKEHSCKASSEGGKIGGKAEAWNKNKTKETDPRILKHVHYGEKNGFYGKKHTPESINKIKKKKSLSEEEYKLRLLERGLEFEVKTKYSEYYSRQHQYLDIICKKCGTEQRKTLQAFERKSLCIKCYPCITSRAEVEVLDFIKSLGIKTIQSDRKSIAPKEIDVFIPDKMVGIEYHGLYWHMENNNNKNKYWDKNSHRDKMLLCRQKKINLIQIFSDEWIEKNEIVKSIIKNKLGLTDIKIGARKCEIREIHRKISKLFFEENHISGYTRSKISFGLYYENKLVCAIALRKPNHKKYKNNIEISRFATALNVQVIGGFSKLMKSVEKWMSDKGYKKIITYSDLRWGDGNVYRSCGFEWVSDTGIDFWYTDGTIRYNRFMFRAQPGKTEKQVAEENGVYRIYGCGNYLYEKKI